MLSEEPPWLWQRATDNSHLEVFRHCQGDMRCQVFANGSAGADPQTWHSVLGNTLGHIRIPDSTHKDDIPVICRPKGLPAFVWDLSEVSQTIAAFWTLNVGANNTCTVRPLQNACVQYFVFNQLQNPKPVTGKDEMMMPGFGAFRRPMLWSPETTRVGCVEKPCLLLAWYTYHPYHQSVPPWRIWQKYLI